MTDIILISTSIFYSIKEALILDEKITQKYTDLYNKYDCFSKVHIPSPNVSLSSSNTFVGQRNKFKSNNHPPIRTTNLKKTIVGLLNIINDTNYLKMFNKIRIIMNPQNIEYIINELLQKCCLQIFYIKIFMKLFMNIYEISQTSEKEIISTIVNLYVNNYVDNKEYKITEIVMKNAYDHFCYVQKHKTYMNAKHVLILELFKNNMIKMNIKEYVEYLINEINTCDDETHIEMLLHMITVYIKENLLVNLDIHYNDILEKTANQKIKFMISDLINMQHSC